MSFSRFASVPAKTSASFGGKGYQGRVFNDRGDFVEFCRDLHERSVGLKQNIDLMSYVF